MTRTGSDQATAVEPGWVRDAIWWHVYPLGFVGAPRVREEADRPTPRLRHLEAYLDYAVELGASGLALGPLFDSETHGYDTVDHFAVDPRLGTEGDLMHLVDEARSRGMRVLLDGVFNHVGWRHPKVQQALREGAESQAARWFHPTTRPDGGGLDFQVFEGNPGLIVLNHDEPEVVAHVIEVMTYWLDRGVDGWRLDAAYAVPATFWAQVVPVVRRHHPEAFVVGEVIHGDYGRIVSDTGLDSVTQYEVWKAIWSSLNDSNFHELAWSLKRHNAYLDTFTPVTFIGNHDVTRVASKIRDPRHRAHALVILLTIGGTPVIYYGDEQGFEGVKEDRAGGDDAVRQAFPDAGPSALPPDGWETYRLHQDLVGLRRRHPWLHTARTSPIHVENAGLVYEAGAEGSRLVIALNVGDDPLRTGVPGVGRVLSGSAEIVAAGRQDACVIVPAHGWAVLD